MGIKRVSMQITKTTIVTILLIISLIKVYGQKTDSFDADFKNGKELFNLKKYGLAMQAFKPLTSSVAGNPYSKIASFYYAVSAYHDNHQQLAKDMFLQLANRNEDWQRIDEVYLWLTNIYLAEENFQRALVYSSRISDDNIMDDAAQLKNNYLEKLSFNTLDSLLSLYPSDPTIAKNLADKIIKKPIHEQDRELLENIVSVFELDPLEYRVAEQLESEKKDVYHVALLLPFMYDEISENTKHLSNEFVIQLYEGILMGVSDLRNMGINLSLHLYDTKKSGHTTSRILQLEELKHMDLIIGPLYPEPVRIVSEFAFEQKINMLNPLSANSRIIENNPYAFLFMPTNELQASKAAEVVSRRIENNNVFIFYSTDSRDSVLAYSYKQEIETLGFQVCRIEEVPVEEGKRILDLLTNTITVEFDEDEFDSLVVEDKVEGNLRITEKDYLVIQPDSIGHIFVASDEPALVANTITGLETRRDTIGLVGLEKWLDQRSISLASLDLLNAYIIAPTYIDKDNPKYESINARYIETFNTYPQPNFYTGYDAIITLGKLMKKSGNLFQFTPGVNDYIPGEILQGLSFGSENCNQVVPIVNFEDTELKLINPRN
jgi:hypothetical protein